MLDVDPAFEHGVLCVRGCVEFGGIALGVAALGYRGPGCASLLLSNPGDGPARLMLLGGPPFGEELVIWWNFIGRSHDEIVGYRRQWQDGHARYGAVNGYRGPLSRLPAPAMPAVRLRPRP